METSKKNRMLSSKSTTTIPTVVKMDRYAHAVRKNFMMRSLASLERLLRFQRSDPDLVPPASTVTRYPPNLVRAHLRSRQASGNQRILQSGDLWLDTKNYAARVKGDWVDLRPQEFRLLIALAQSSGVPVSRQELVRRAAPGRRKTSSRTVDMHISRIRACVEAPSDYTYIHSIRGIGYRFEPVPKKTSSRASPREASR